jgi:RND family efflux transporter MFP subunit
VGYGRHRIGNARHSRNGTTPTYRAVDPNELRVSSSAVTDQLPNLSVGTHGAPTHSRGTGPGTSGHGEGETSTIERATAVTPTPHGVARIRYGTREIGTGLFDLSRPGLEAIRRHLPSRIRSVGLHRLALALVVVSALLLGIALTGASTLAKTLKGPTSVVVAIAGPSVINSRPGGVGSIAASPQNVSTVSLNVQGITAPIQVTAVDVLAGQQVTAGAPLLELAPQPFEQNEQYVSATLQQAQHALAAAQAAASSGGTTSSAGGYLAVQIPTLAGQVAIDQQLLQIASGNSNTLTAPASGYVAYVKVTPGQIVNPGDPLVQIVDPSQVNVSSGMQLSDLHSITAGDAVTITPSQLPGVHLHGTVLAISAAAADGGLEGTVVVTAANPGSHPVPIGTQAFINVSAPLHAAVSVPTISVLNVEVAPVVGVISHKRIHFHPVVIGASDGNRTQILSGLRAGEQVAISNLQVLTDGDKVNPSPGGS